VLEIEPRYVHILGATANPGRWITQQACNLLLDLDECAETSKFLIRIEPAGSPPRSTRSVPMRAQVLKTPAGRRRANAYADTFVRIAREPSDRMLILDRRHL
jgi:putative transposase